MNTRSIDMASLLSLPSEELSLNSIGRYDLENLMSPREKKGELELDDSPTTRTNTPELTDSRSEEQTETQDDSNSESEDEDDILIRNDLANSLIFTFFSTKSPY